MADKDLFLSAFAKIGYALNRAVLRWVRVVDIALPPFFHVTLDFDSKPPSDNRIQRLDEARMALEEGLLALDDLQREADEKQTLHQKALHELALTLESKDTAERKLASIQTAMKTDIDAFKTLAGVSDPGKERVIGFWSGVAASTLVTIAFAIGSWAWKKWLG